MPRPLNILASVLLSASLAWGNVAEAKPRVISLNEVEASPMSLMVAKKIEMPLIIILDPSKIAEPWEASRRMTISDWPTFVSRDLKASMETYFSSVVVQGPSDPVPTEPHAVVDVKIDRVQFRPIQAGGLTYNVMEMQWGMAVRLAGADDYLFSFAGTAQSKETYSSALVGLGQLIESAIGGMLSAWTEKDVTGSLRTGAGG